MDQGSHQKFDMARAEEYAQQARIALAGYDACHELSACILSAAIGERRDARVLVVGAGGTGGEILAAAKLEAGWRFVAVDPSAPMLDLSKAQIEAAGFLDRVDFVCSAVSDLAPEAVFDAALVIGVLHHVKDDADKAALLRDVAVRLLPGGSMVLAGNYRAYASEPLLLAAWANRWRLAGADEDEVRRKRDTIMRGAAPPESEDKVVSLLMEAGFEAPERFFSSLFWGAWHTRRVDGI
jgi:tRNA (cmo5U34)-methyltransferase